VSVKHDWRLGPYTVDDCDDPVRFPPDEGTYEMRDGWVLMSPWHDLNHVSATARRKTISPKWPTTHVRASSGIG
jgi:hypothetical protein